MNQRRRFRHAGRGGELSVALKSSVGIENGRLTALGVDFLEAEFPAHVADQLKVDETVTVILHALSAGHRIDLEATAHSLGAGEGTRVSAGFKLSESSSAQILEPEMWELCSRASSVFYRFTERLPAAMDFEPPRPEGFETVSIVELSTLKARIRIRRTMAASLSVFDRVRMSFELPDTNKLVEVGGSVVELSVQDETYLLGTVNFDTATSEYDLASHVLSRFLRERQASLFEGY
jgi:hypothetical protein